ncbi:MAG: TatD family hydrolase [Clostridia bacterium]|nr:TatD family hydrolase [Clostridia bacterium]
MVDVHAHLTDQKFDDVEQVVARAEESGVGKIICSAYNLLSSQQAVDLSKRLNQVYANVGIHPENVEEWSEETIKNLENLSKNSKIVAIGEIGLDYYWRQDTKEKQKQIFVDQINLANKLNLPIVVHSREAMGDTIEILKNNRPNKESLLHCYSGSVESAKILMDLGFSFSFGGVVTFSNAKTAVEVVKSLPIEKILLETDCPYLTPVPFRGKRNEPKNVVYVADMIARIKNMTIEEVAEKTTENAKRLFGI